MTTRPQQKPTKPHHLGNRPRDANGRPSGLADDHPAVVAWRKTQRKPAVKPATGGK